MNNYLDQIKNTIAKHNGSEEITPESYFEDDLNVGELELIEILTELEDEYHIDLISRKGEVETVQDLVDLISELVE